MKKKLFDETARKQLARSRKSLHRYFSKQDPASLHQYRVAIKKIKAEHAFAGALKGHFTDASVLQPGFHAGGRLRNFHVYGELLESLPRRPLRLIGRLRSEESDLRQRFVKAIPGYLQALDAYARKISVNIPVSHHKRIRHYLEKKKRKIIELLENPDRKSMHLCRKHVKRLLYIAEWMPGKWTKGLDTDFLDTLQEKAGRWHDTYAFLLFAMRRGFTSRQYPHAKLKAIEERQFKAILTFAKKARHSTKPREH